MFKFTKIKLFLSKIFFGGNNAPTKKSNNISIIDTPNKLAQGILDEKTSKLVDILTTNIKSDNSFDIEVESDIIYEQLTTLGFPVKRTIVPGTVTFIIVDEVFLTYLDVVYNTNSIKEYILNIFYKINPNSTTYTELTFAGKFKEFKNVMSKITTNKQNLIT